MSVLCLIWAVNLWLSDKVKERKKKRIRNLDQQKNNLGDFFLSLTCLLHGQVVCLSIAATAAPGYLPRWLLNTHLRAENAILGPIMS